MFLVGNGWWSQLEVLGRTFYVQPLQPTTMYSMHDDKLITRYRKAIMADGLISYVVLNRVFWQSGMTLALTLGNWARCEKYSLSRPELREGLTPGNRRNRGHCLATMTSWRYCIVTHQATDSCRRLALQLLFDLSLP